ncbi:hypothetical protein SAMN05192530_107200 [Aureimonas jatrophae]|uniref:Uncharacterized protein n=1 Tax=Aureimonas jatrophae TaxID=1166073 RepID=A0A1H0KC59_9HYPH|nr:hypothetical protein SAMN05192530_107200 [Aureimonas jatrophae]
MQPGDDADRTDRDRQRFNFVLRRSVFLQLQRVGRCGSQRDLPCFDTCSPPPYASRSRWMPKRVAGVEVESRPPGRGRPAHPGRLLPDVHTHPARPGGRRAHTTSVPGAVARNSPPTTRFSSNPSRPRSQTRTFRRSHHRPSAERCRAMSLQTPMPSRRPSKATWSDRPRPRWRRSNSSDVLELPRTWAIASAEGRWCAYGTAKTSTPGPWPSTREASEAGPAHPSHSSSKNGAARRWTRSGRR